MQHLEVSGAVRHIYIYVVRRLKVNKNCTEIHGQQNIKATDFFDILFHFPLQASGLKCV